MFQNKSYFCPTKWGYETLGTTNDLPFP